MPPARCSTRSTPKTPCPHCEQTFDGLTFNGHPESDIENGRFECWNCGMFFRIVPDGVMKADDPRL